MRKVKEIQDPIHQEDGHLELTKPIHRDNKQMVIYWLLYLIYQH